VQTNPARTSLLTGEIAFSAGEIMQEAGVGVSKRVRLINRDGILEIQHVPAAMIRCLDIISSRVKGEGVMSHVLSFEMQAERVRDMILGRALAVKFKGGFEYLD